MNQFVESVDNLPKPPPQDRVNRMVRSKEEEDQESFDRTLKKKMKKKKNALTKTELVDVVTLDSGETADKQTGEDVSGENETDVNDDYDRIKGMEAKIEDQDKTDKSGPSDHIDLEA